MNVVSLLWNGNPFQSFLLFKKETFIKSIETIVPPVDILQGLFLYKKLHKKKEEGIEVTDQEYMLRAICLAKKGEGWTNPNPMVGAVIVKDNSIKSTGYNGAPKGRKNCTEIGQCPRITNNTQRGTNYALGCRACHSEWNAIINASPEEMKDATLYLYGYDRVAKRIVKDANCCPICKRMIINAGIKDVVIVDLDNGIGHPEVPYRYRTIKVADWVENDESLQANEGY